MKKLLIATALMLLSVVPSLAKQIKIDTYLTATNGCKFHVTGWVDVGCCPSVRGYDVTMSGDCGRYQFTSRMVNPNTGHPIADSDNPTYAWRAQMKNLDATECEIMYQAKDDPANAFSPLLMALGTQIPLDAIMTTQLMNELNQLVEASPEYGY